MVLKRPKRTFWPSRQQTSCRKHPGGILEIELVYCAGFWTKPLKRKFRLYGAILADQQGGRVVNPILYGMVLDAHNELRRKGLA